MEVSELFMGLSRRSSTHFYINRLKIQFTTHYKTAHYAEIQ